MEVQIWFWSLAVWPPTFLFLNFSTLYSSSLWRIDTSFFSKLISPPSPSQISLLSLLSPPPPPSNGLEINRGFVVIEILRAFKHWLDIFSVIFTLLYRKKKAKCQASTIPTTQEIKYNVALLQHSIFDINYVKNETASSKFVSSTLLINQTFTCRHWYSSKRINFNTELRKMSWVMLLERI